MWFGRFRGYHNMAALMKDGRVLVGGGMDYSGDVGCEHPNVRLYNPPYTSKGSSCCPPCITVHARSMQLDAQLTTPLPSLPLCTPSSSPPPPPPPLGPRPALASQGRDTLD